MRQEEEEIVNDENGVGRGGKIVKAQERHMMACTGVKSVGVPVTTHNHGHKATMSFTMGSKKACL